MIAKHTKMSRSVRDADPEGLSRTERRVVDLERAGEDRHAIARALGMSWSTVTIHLCRSQQRGAKLRTPILSHAERGRQAHGPDGITHYTRRIADMVAGGADIHAVAAEFGIEVHTVRGHLIKARRGGMALPPIPKAEPRPLRRARWEPTTEADKRLLVNGRCICGLLLPCVCLGETVGQAATVRVCDPGGSI